MDSISDLDEVEYSKEEMADFEKLYEQSLTEITEGQIVEGRVINISQIGVAVDIGFKSEGVIPAEEFDDLDKVNPGDVIKVYLESVEGEDGNLLLSKRKADFLNTWEDVKKIYAEQTLVKGRCLRRVKGGIVVDLMTIDAFLPGSQIDVYPVRDFDALIGKTMDFKIVKLNEQRKNVVLSRKIILEINYLIEKTD